MTLSRCIALVAWIALLGAGCGAGEERVVVAAGTTVVDSGVMDDLATRYEAFNPAAEISVVGVATAEALELGAQGAASLLITHAPAAEAEFLALYPGAVAVPVFASRFALAAPRHVAASLAGLSLSEALRRIASDQLLFVSRADGSGTHARETAAWTAAGVDPVGNVWFVETGQGMGLTLQVAHQRGGVLLVEVGAWRAAQRFVALVEVSLVLDDALINPYRAIIPTQDPAAEAFSNWLTSADGKAAIVEINEQRFGEVLYVPATP